MYRHMWRAGAVLSLAGATLLVPTPAQALEDVASTYEVGCSLFGEHHEGTGHDGTPLTYDGERTGAHVSVAGHTLGAEVRAALPSDPPVEGEDCWGSAQFSDRLTVQPGSSGLTEGQSVPVTVSVTVEADLDQDWGSGPTSSFTLADYAAEASIVSLDDCDTSSEATVCDTPLSYVREHEHQIDAMGPDGWAELRGFYAYDFETNTRDRRSDRVDEDKVLCEGWPCPVDEQHPVEDAPEARETITGSATLVVGDRYDVTGAVALLAAAHDSSEAWANVSVDELTIDVQPAAGGEGVDLVYASEGQAPDRTAPAVTADVDSAPVGGWHAAPAVVTLSAADETEVASVGYQATGADPQPETTIPGDTATVTVDADGVTELTYWATDAAGNTSQPTTMSVRVDTSAPVLATPEDISMTSTDGNPVRVDYEVTATDQHDGSPGLSCDPPSGSDFPVGSTTVTCESTDHVGNTSSTSFTVDVTASVDPMTRLREAIEQLGLPHGLHTALMAKHSAAAKGFASGSTTAGCGALAALENQVRAQAGKKIAAPDAAEIRGLVAGVEDAYGC